MNILPAGIAARLAGTAQAVRRDGWMALHVLGRPREVATGIESLWHMLVQGGLRIETPLIGPPLIASTVQIDGDIWTVVAGGVMAWPPERQRMLSVEHSDAVRQALLRLPPLAALWRTALASLFLLFAGLQSYAAVAASIAAWRASTGGWLSDLMHAAREEAFTLAVAIIPLLIRLVLPAVAASVLRLYTGRLWQQWHVDTAAWLQGRSAGT